jgi:carboxymethylenebutenolidase
MAAPPGSLYDPASLVDEEIVFTGYAEGVVDAYLARPVAPGPCPGVLLIHAAPGVTDHSRDVVRRIAALGHVCCVPNLYTREPDPPADFAEMMERLYARSDAQVLGDLQAAVAHLRAREDAAGPVGAIGFCMGGRYALLLARTGALDSVVDCWGGFLTRADPDNVTTPQRPVPPIDVVADIACPVLAAIGLDDTNPSPQDGRLLAERLPGAQVDFYENAGHAFFDDSRDGYRPQAAALLWERAAEFFARTLR